MEDNKVINNTPDWLLPVIVGGIIVLCCCFVCLVVFVVRSLKDDDDTEPPPSLAVSRLETPQWDGNTTTEFSRPGNNNAVAASANYGRVALETSVASDYSHITPESAGTSSVSAF